MPLLVLFLLLCLIQEPSGEEVHWVLGLRLVHDRHAFGNDKSQVALLEVLCVRLLSVDHLTNKLTFLWQFHKC